MTSTNLFRRPTCSRDVFFKSMVLATIVWSGSVCNSIGQVITFEVKVVDLKGGVLSSTPIAAGSPLSGWRLSDDGEDVEVVAVLLVNDGRRNAYSVNNLPNLASGISGVTRGGIVTVNVNVGGLGVNDEAFIALVSRRVRNPPALFTAITSFMAVPRESNIPPNQMVIAVPEPKPALCAPCRRHRCWARRCW